MSAAGILWAQISELVSPRTSERRGDSAQAGAILGVLRLPRVAASAARMGAVSRWHGHRDSLRVAGGALSQDPATFARRILSPQEAPLVSMALAALVPSG
jgi:hypothetical protein